MCDFVCPNCGSNYHSGCDTGMTTAVYYPPIYKDGVNINPDGNSTIRSIKCLNCNKTFEVNSCKGIKTFKESI